MVESSNPAAGDTESTTAISAGMVESSNSAGDDLDIGAGMAEPTVAVSVWNYLRYNVVVAVWNYLRYVPLFIMWSVVLWFNIDHYRRFGPWSELAFFLVGTMPLLVLMYLLGRQDYLLELEQEQAAQVKKEQAAQVKKEQPMMPTQVLRWEDMVESSNSAGDDLDKGAGAAKPNLAISVWNYLRYNVAVSVWNYLRYVPLFIMWSVVLWFNIDHYRRFGPWSELAFFLVGTMPLLVLMYLIGRQDYLLEQEQAAQVKKKQAAQVKKEQAAQVKKEQPMMPTQVLRWEDMVESSNSAGDDLDKGAGAAKPNLAISVWNYLRYNVAVSVWNYLRYVPLFIMWSVVLWFNIDHYRRFGPWSELAFFLVGTMPLLVLMYLIGRQDYLLEQEQAAQVKKEQPMMPTQVLRWEDMVESSKSAGDDLDKGAGAAEPNVAVSVWNYLRYNVAVSIWNCLRYVPLFIMWSVVLWFNIDHYRRFGLWSELAFFLVGTMPLLVLMYLIGRQDYLLEQEQAAQVKKEQPMMPTQVLRWEDMAMEL